MSEGRGKGRERGKLKRGKARKVRREGKNGVREDGGRRRKERKVRGREG